jgi:hypothetical protein
MIRLPHDIIFCSVHTVRHTALFLNALTMDSGDMSFLAIFIHCQAMLQMVFWYFQLVSGQFPVQVTKSLLERFVNCHVKNCSCEVIPPDVIVISEVESVTFSVKCNQHPSIMQNTWPCVPHFSQPFNCLFLCHLPFLITLNGCGSGNSQWEAWVWSQATQYGICGGQWHWDVFFPANFITSVISAVILTIDSAVEVNTDRLFSFASGHRSPCYCQVTFHPIMYDMLLSCS